jgi:hypothetical protein
VTTQQLSYQNSWVVGCKCTALQQQQQEKRRGSNVPRVFENVGKIVVAIYAHAETLVVGLEFTVRDLAEMLATAVE